MKLSKLAIGLCALSAFTAVPASADLLSTSTMTNARIYGDGSSHFIPMFNSGSTTLWFYTNSAYQRVGFAFNGECTVDGNTDYKWLNIDLLVDGTVIAPSNGDNAFCTSDGDGNLGNWVSASTNGAYRVPKAGWHRFQVRGRLMGFSTGDRWRIDDTSALIMR